MSGWQLPQQFVKALRSLETHESRLSLALKLDSDGALVCRSPRISTSSHLQALDVLYPAF